MSVQAKPLAASYVTRGQGFGPARQQHRKRRTCLKQQAWPQALCGGDCRPRNACTRVWSGTVKAAAFPRFQLQEFASAAAARGFLADRGIAHYWDLATAQEPEEQ